MTKIFYLFFFLLTVESCSWEQSVTFSLQRMVYDISLRLRLLLLLLRLLLLVPRNCLYILLNISWTLLFSSSVIPTFNPVTDLGVAVGDFFLTVELGALLLLLSLVVYSSYVFSSTFFQEGLLLIYNKYKKIFQCHTFLFDQYISWR